MADFRKTWAGLGIDLPEFSVWLETQKTKFASESAAKLCYLAWLYDQRAKLVSNSLLGDACPFAKEVRLACDQLSVTGESSYADRVIRGERLAPNLHQDYVAKTNCYRGSDG